jgi:hypothetical protein
VVSTCVRYLPMRVFAAFSQWVSDDKFCICFNQTGSLVFYLAGFTSTSAGRSESFLLHFGQTPLYCWMISSGGLRSAPSYRMWLHPWHLTRWGIWAHFRVIWRNRGVAYLLIAKFCLVVVWFLFLSLGVAL